MTAAPVVMTAWIIGTPVAAPLGGAMVAPAAEKGHGSRALKNAHARAL